MATGPDISDLARKVDEASRAAEVARDDAGASRFGRAVNAMAEAAGVAVLATIVFLVFFNAVGRYAFQYTFIWGDEMVLSLLPWLGMLGMFLSIRRRQIIRIDLFAARRRCRSGARSTSSRACSPRRPSCTSR